jgi:nucleoside-diphosphate-sugar epimerase
MKQRGGFMKIVVIGGTGLIGSKTVAILRQGGQQCQGAASSVRGRPAVSGLQHCNFRQLHNASLTPGSHAHS